MTRVLVTGAAGKAGSAIVGDLLAAGYEVSAADLVAPRRDIGVEVVRADLLDQGQVFELLDHIDVAVHMAGIPGFRIVTPTTVFNTNTLTTTNLFFAAAQLGVQKVIWASSETVLGVPFATPPRSVPMDEGHGPYPEQPYALSKVICEVAAEHVSRWSGMPIVGLRYSNIMVAEEYLGFEAWQDDADVRKWDLWGYIDARDAAAAARLAIETPTTGSENFVIAAADTVMRRLSRELLDEVFPGTALSRQISGRESLQDWSKAHRVLGWTPEHSWLD